MSAKPLTRCEADRLLSPLKRFPRLALAVSGGPDSLALMHLAYLQRDEMSKISVLTVDHDLREGSRAEAETVARIAQSLGFRPKILTWRHDGIDARVQARARDARYGLMAAYCAAHDVPALVTAHHLDDCAETFLMRLKRGSGLDGLAAMAEQSSFAGLTLLRPLLDIPKAVLVATVRAAGLPVITDPSNLDPRFERSRLRGAMERFAQEGFTAEALARSARRLRRARAAVEVAVNDFIERHVEREAAGYASVDLPAYLRAPEEIALRALQRLTCAVGGVLEPVRLAKLEAAYDALKQDPEKAQTLGGCQLVPAKRRLFLFREIRKKGLPDLTLRPGESGLWDNRFRVALSAEAEGPLTVRALGRDGARKLKGRKALPRSIPARAARALPACWRKSELLGLPAFDRADPPSDGLGTTHPSCPRHEGGIDCRAVFLWGGP